MSDNSNEPLDYECCDEHEVSYMGACGLCLTEEINEMIADPKAISLVDKDFLKAVLSFIPAPATSSDDNNAELIRDIETCLCDGLSIHGTKGMLLQGQRKLLVRARAALEKNDE